MKYKLIIFDWDGTLIDSFASIIQAAKLVCAELGLPIPKDEEMRQLIGLDIARSLTKLFPDKNRSEILEMSDRFYWHYSKLRNAVALHVGVLEILEQLYSAGYLLTIATGKSRFGLDEDLEKLNIQHLFYASRCADETASKPDPQMVDELLDICDVDPKKALVIGDSIYDIEMAVAAGVDAVAINYPGISFNEDINALNPIAVIHSINELLPILSFNKGINVDS